MTSPEVATQASREMQETNAPLKMRLLQSMILPWAQTTQKLAASIWVMYVSKAKVDYKPWAI